MVTMCGGLSLSDLFVQTASDVLELPVVRPAASQSAVVLGAAMLGAAAAKKVPLEIIAREMQQPGRVFRPNKRMKSYHSRYFKILV